MFVGVRVFLVRPNRFLRVFDHEALYHAGGYVVTHKNIEKRY